MKTNILTNPDVMPINENRIGLWKQILKNKYIYLFLLPGIIYIILFSYIPMYGITLAFKKFMVNKGILGSPWIGIENFKTVYNDPYFWKAFINTFRMGFMYIITGFPAPIILAILLNELGGVRYKKTLQTIFTFPNFLSWVLVGGIMTNFLSTNGIINELIKLTGSEGYELLTNENLIRPILYLTNIWKGAGWSAIIYLAAIAGINPELYEAAMVDGANRFHKIVHITWPSIKSTAVIMLILAFGSIMNQGFDQILNIVNPVVKDYTEILDTYIYRVTFDSSYFDYGFSTAMGLFKSIINFVFLLTANKLAKILGEGGIF